MSDRGELAVVIVEAQGAGESATDAILASDWLAKVKAEAWKEGALWAAVECGAIRHPRNAFLVPEDNPYRTTETTKD